jgi:membrane protease YdiL (CAAX protease family)
MPLFWILAFAIAWALTVPGMLSQLGYAGSSPIPQGATNLIGLAPAIAAFIAAAATGRFRELWRRVVRFNAPAWTYVLVLLLPAAFLAMPFVVSRVTGEDAPSLILVPEVAIFSGLWFVLAWGEEIGWRGFALPRLVERFGFWTGATILGAIWCVWHYPKMLSGPYVTDIMTALPFIGLFSLQIVIANYLICWLFERSGCAVIIPVLFHTAFNTVSTIYPMAALDLNVTAFMAVLVVLIALFDREIGRATEKV